MSRPRPTAATRSGTRLVLLGYFARGNLGDDAMHVGLLSFLASDAPGTHVDSRPLPEWSLHGLPAALNLLRKLRQADFVVLAGGTHFHDRRGAKSHRILATHWLLFRTARLFGARVGYAGIGVGPLDSALGRTLTRLLVKMATATLVRDLRSAKVLDDLGVGRCVTTGFDSASLLRPRQATPVAHCDRLGVSITSYFTVFGNESERDLLVARSLGEVLTHFVTTDSLLIDVLAFHTAGKANDVAVSAELADAISPAASRTLYECVSVKDTVERLRSLSGLIATRYHAALLGYLVGLPLVIVAYEEKCLALAEQIGLPAWAVIAPEDLMNSERMTATIGRLRSEPESFTAALPPADAVIHAERGLREFMRILTPASAVRAGSR